MGRAGKLGVTCEQRDTSFDLGLEDAVDIACAVELKTVLVDALQSGKQVRVALDRCSALDVTAIQLLFAAEREARSRGVPFALTGLAPDGILAALEEAGFENLSVSV